MGGQTTAPVRDVNMRPESTISDALGVPEDKIHLAQADTDEVILRGKRFAAHFMEADTADIAFVDGAFTIAGTDRSMPIGQVAQMSFIPVGLPSDSASACRVRAVSPRI